MYGVDEHDWRGKREKYLHHSYHLERVSYSRMYNVASELPSGKVSTAGRNGGTGRDVPVVSRESACINPQI